MVSSDALASVVPLVSWLVLPNIFTKLLLQGVYQTQLLSLPSNAQQQQQHTQVARAIVIASYLVYTIYASLFQRQDNFYQVLGIPLESDTDDIRRAFRKLARIHHPDKVGGGTRSEAFFILLRRAHDGLVEPTKRFAYDRFGPDVMRWGSDTITEREFFSKGITHSLSFYVINPIILGGMNWLNGEKVFTFWRSALLALIFTLEVSLVMAPQSPPALIRLLLPNQTVHDLVGCLHTTFIAINLASRHLESLLPPLEGTMGKMREMAQLEGRSGGGAKSGERGLQDMVQAMVLVQDLSTGVRVETARSMAHSLQPLRPQSVSTTATLQEAAREAAEARASGAVPGQRPKAREPSKAEEAWIHLFGQRILRAQVEAHAQQRQQQQQQQQQRQASGQVTVAAPVAEGPVSTSTSSATSGTSSPLSNTGPETKRRPFSNEVDTHVPLSSS